MQGGAEAPAAEPPPFPAEYASATDSGLTFTVAEGANTHDIPLTDK